MSACCFWIGNSFQFILSDWPIRWGSRERIFENSVPSISQVLKANWHRVKICCTCDFIKTVNEVFITFYFWQLTFPIQFQQYVLLLIKLDSNFKLVTVSVWICIGGRRHSISAANLSHFVLVSMISLSVLYWNRLSAWTCFLAHTGAAYRSRRRRSTRVLQSFMSVACFRPQLEPQNFLNMINCLAIFSSTCCRCSLKFSLLSTMKPSIFVFLVTLQALLKNFGACVFSVLS